MDKSSNAAPVSCPSCGRTVVNRLVDHCLFCGKALPPQLCLSAEEKASEYEALRQLRDRHRKASSERAKDIQRILDAFEPGDLGIGDW